MRHEKAIPPISHRRARRSCVIPWASHPGQGSNGAVLLRTSAALLPSAAEVNTNDAWQRAVVGLACVSNSSEQVHSVMFFTGLVPT
ncbi:MAG: DUF503 family protein [Anaerolineales bacterium]|nr:DUF503 family protein [Anaerolineales bacterium]